MTNPQIACLRITLDDVDPVVLRRIEVPLDLRLDRLHLTLQAAMGWDNSHLYEFSWKRQAWGDPDDSFDDDRLPAAKTTLNQLLAAITGKTFRYTYDFGDSWDHTIKLERITPPEADARYPRLTEAANRCPPEDCGGAPGYERLRQILADPAHEEYADQMEWIGQFDAADPETDRLRAGLAALAKKWTRKPRAS